MEMPAARYELSERELPVRLPEHEYPTGVEVRRVRRDGGMKWKSRQVFVGELVGLRGVGDGVLRVQLGDWVLGLLHERFNTIVPIGDASVNHVPDQMC